MNMHGSRLLGFIFWATYLIAAMACWLTTYQVFAQSDTPLVAGLAAASIDGVLALTLYLMGRTNHQDQRTTALIGTFVFGIFSAFAQVIHRFDGLGLVMPEWMRIVSLFLLPASTTGGLVLLGVLKYFSASGNKNQNQGKQNQQNYGSFQRSSQESQHRIPESFQGERIPIQGPPVPRVAMPQGNGNGRKFEDVHEPFPKLANREDPTSLKP